MNTGRPNPGKGHRPTPARWLVVILGLLVAGLGVAGCAVGGQVPRTKDLHNKKGRPQAVVLVRLVTEIDGRPNPAFPSVLAMDSVWLAWGDFTSGGRLRLAPQGFLSPESRKEGWTYLLLEPGIHYFGVNTPQNSDSFTYDASWRQLPPRWRLTVPTNTPVVYAGTLFVPGSGSWLIFGGRQMQQFDPERFEIRDETERAAEIHAKWLAKLGPLTTQLVKPHRAGEPLVFETPPNR